MDYATSGQDAQRDINPLFDIATDPWTNTYHTINLKQKGGQRPASGHPTQDGQPRPSGKKKNRPQTAIGGTKSMMSTQANSKNESAPSYSFGTSGRSKLITGTPLITPGPIYNPVSTKGWLGDTPNFGFGTQQQRPRAKNIGRFSGKSNQPGPGAYANRSSLGVQSVSRSRSASAFSFGNSQQIQKTARNTLDPGPVYAVPDKVTKGGMQEMPSWSFGYEQRAAAKSRLAGRTPGPGAYNAPSSMSTQAESSTASSANFGFGSASRDAVHQRLFHGKPHEVLQQGRHSPGPRYAHESSMGMQHSSLHRSAPTFGFGSSSRLPGSSSSGALVSQAPGPGPGSYVI